MSLGGGGRQDVPEPEMLKRAVTDRLEQAHHPGTIS